MKLNAGYASAPHFLSLLLSALGRTDQAVASARQARELDPLSLIIGAIAVRCAPFDSPRHTRAVSAPNARCDCRLAASFASDAMSCASLEKHAAEELSHALIIAKQIDYLGGDIATEPMPVRTSAEPEKMLQFDLDNENETVRHYRQRVDLMMYERQRQEILKDLGADPYVD